MGEQMDKQRFFDRASAYLKKHGFFVVAALCALCAGIAALVTLLPGASDDTPAPAPPSAESALEQNAAEQNVAEQAAVSSDESLNTADTAHSTPSDTAQAQPEEKGDAAPASKSKSKSPAPVEGDILFGYAVDTLLYSETLDLWTTHAGVDIAAKLGTTVRCIRGGTVEEVYNSPDYGVCVRVRHDNELESVYGNLEEKPPVKQGQKLNAGDAVGNVGASAASECMIPPHLHFEVLKKGESEDPFKHVLLKK